MGTYLHAPEDELIKLRAFLAVHDLSAISLTRTRITAHQSNQFSEVQRFSGDSLDYGVDHQLICVLLILLCGQASSVMRKHGSRPP